MPGRANPAGLTRVDAIASRMQVTVGELGAAEQLQGVELMELVPVIVDARRAMNQALEQMDLAGFSGAVAGFREQTTEGRLQTLSMISDARVLLNLYTVFLLVMLGYLGLRLRASYAALNRSHG